MAHRRCVIVLTTTLAYTDAWNEEVEVRPGSTGWERMRGYVDLKHVSRTVIIDASTYGPPTLANRRLARAASVLQS